MSRKRYAIVGVSGRAIGMYMDNIRQTYSDKAQLVAMLDKDSTRMARYNEKTALELPCYSPDEFVLMVEETKPNVVIVACPDAFHHEYVIKALAHDLDVLIEKPLTIDEAKCAAIARAAAASKAKARVTFNFRYAPAATRLHELLAEGKVGRVVSVELNWYLNTWHGRSYFQRWHRLREISGGLSVHKACHHLDLVSWWIGQRAVEVHAYGGLSYYGPKGPHNPLRPDQIGDGRTCPTCDMRQKCKYFRKWDRIEDDLRLARKEKESIDATDEYQGYTTHQCIYDPEINIEDNYSALVKYDGGAVLSYTLNASVPYEGYRLTINGTEGRIEYTELDGINILPYSQREPEQMPITYIPMFGGRERIDVILPGGTENLGGHHGADPLILDEIFLGPDPMVNVTRQAGIESGIEAVLTGVAIHRSVNEHTTISIDQMRQRVYAV